MADAAIITVNYHSGALIARLESVVDGTPGLRLCVVDNSGEFTATRPGTAVIKSPANIGFGRACNLGAREAAEDLLLFVNPDVEVDRDALLRLVATAPAKAVWGPIIDDGRGWSSAIVARGGIIPLKRVGFPVGRASDYRSVYISGAFLGIGRELFLRLGGFREDIFMYAEDLDLCHRATQAGAPVVTVTDVTVRHRSGTSSSKSRKILPKLLRLGRSVRGHYTYLRSHFPDATALITAVYLASGRQSR